MLRLYSIACEFLIQFFVSFLYIGIAWITTGTRVLFNTCTCNYHKDPNLELWKILIKLDMTWRHARLLNINIRSCVKWPKCKKGPKTDPFWYGSSSSERTVTLNFYSIFGQSRSWRCDFITNWGLKYIVTSWCRHLKSENRIYIYFKTFSTFNCV